MKKLIIALTVLPFVHTVAYGADVSADVLFLRATSQSIVYNWLNSLGSDYVKIEGRCFGSKMGAGVESESARVGCAMKKTDYDKVVSVCNCSNGYSSYVGGTYSSHKSILPMEASGLDGYNNPLYYKDKNGNDSTGVPAAVSSQSPTTIKIYCSEYTYCICPTGKYGTVWLASGGASGSYYCANCPSTDVYVDYDDGWSYSDCKQNNEPTVGVGTDLHNAVAYMATQITDCYYTRSASSSTGGVGFLDKTGNYILVNDDKCKYY